MPRNVDLLDESKNTMSTVWYLAWPIMLEQVLIMLVNYVDTAMVGALGPNATAAIALTSPANWLLNGLFAGVSIGFSVPVGRCIGARDFERAKAIVRQAVLAIGACGLFMTVVMQFISPYLPGWMGGEPEILSDASAYIRIISLGYIFTMSVQISSAILRCTGDTRTPLIFNVSTNVINMVLNFFLIYPTRTVTVLGASFTVWGAGLGVTGAAIATAIAIAFSGIMLLRALFSDNAVCKITTKDSFRFDGFIWREMINIGAPTAFERVTISSGQVAMTALVTTLGTASLAAHSLAITAESVTYMPAFGFSAAVTTLVAQALGAGKPALARRYANFCITGCVLFMTAMGFVLFFGGGFLMSVFTPSREVVDIGAAALRIEALAQPFFALSMVCSGILRGARKTKWPFIASLIGMWAVRLPIAWAVTEFTAWGLPGAWIGMAGDLTVRGIICFLIVRKGSWAKNDMPTAAQAGLE